MSAMKLYGMPFSNNFLRALFYMKEKGLEFEVVNVDLMKGEHKANEYLKLNPRGQVPCLVTEDGNVVFESVGIMQFLEHKFPDQNPLYPKEEKALAKCFTRIHEFQQKLDQKNVLGSVLFRKQSFEDLGERATNLLEELAKWDAYLSESKYLAGDSFSMIDIVVFANVAPFYAMLGLPVAKFPNLGDWYGRLRARESIKDAPTWTAWEGMAKSKPEAAIFAHL